MGENRWLAAWGLGSIAAGGASLLVPLYVVNLGAGPGELGVLASMAALAGAVGALVWGRLADRMGRWRLLGVASLGGIGLSLATIPVVSGTTLIVALNGLLWLSFSAATPVFTILTVNDANPGERSGRLAHLNRVQGYGWASGLAIGTVWTVVSSQIFALPALASQRLFFGMCAAMAVGSVLAAGVWLPVGGGRTPSNGTTNRQRNPRPVVASTFPFLPSQLYWKVRGLQPQQFVTRFTPALAAYFFTVALFFAGFGIFFAPLPAYLTVVGYSETFIYLFYVVSALGSAVFFGKAGELSATRNRRSLQAGALSIRGTALPAVALVGSGTAFDAGVLALGGIFALIGAAWAVIALTATEFISDLAPSVIRGEALGMYTALSALAGGLGSLLGGALADTLGYSLTFTVAGIVVLVSAVFVMKPKLLRVGFGAGQKQEAGSSLD
ncbi:MFS transporter [Haladaptatus sp. GCM10025707]|uniref:MFS transporter n=1 Tax=unclassified Haladaptatus TaxID=2622732 RepID=UPI0023E8C0E1|nr:MULTISPECIES: MFS transporter [unclassified Haladaptatus]